jgi:hypothetical protein
MSALEKVAHRQGTKSDVANQKLAREPVQDNDIDSIKVIAKNSRDDINVLEEGMEVLNLSQVKRLQKVLKNFKSV